MRFVQLGPVCDNVTARSVCALWTGQRQGDLLRLPWSAYDGKHIRLRQGKRKRRVTIPVGAPLRGLSLKAVSQILDAHYLSRDVGLAENAIQKLEAGTKAGKTAVKRSGGSIGEEGD